MTRLDGRDMVDPPHLQPPGITRVVVWPRCPMRLAGHEDFFHFP
jgi:hypothetical protein